MAPKITEYELLDYLIASERALETVENVCIWLSEEPREKIKLLRTLFASVTGTVKVRAQVDVHRYID